MRDQRTLSPLASALTRFAPASPLDSALTKNIPGGGCAPCDPLLSTLTLDFQLFSVNSFRLMHFRKNASANPLVSHTFKTKDLKPFRFIHFQKKGRGSPHPANAVIPSEPAILAGDEGPQCSEGREPQSANHESPVYPEARRVTNHESLPLSALTSTLTKKGWGRDRISCFVFGVLPFASFDLALATGRRFPILLGFSRP